jgi:hypothetical protein
LMEFRSFAPTAKMMAVLGLVGLFAPSVRAQSNPGDPLFCDPNEGITFLIVNAFSVEINGLWGFALDPAGAAQNPACSKLGVAQRSVPEPNRESYYSARIVPGFTPSFDLRRKANPAYTPTEVR